MKPCSAVKTGLFADEHHRKKIEWLGDLWPRSSRTSTFTRWRGRLIASPLVSAQGGRPPYPTETTADRGYPSEERATWLNENGFRSPIQRKGKRNKPLSVRQQRRNKRVAKTRAQVEHVFGAI